MTKLQSARAPTTEAFLAEEGPRLADLCTACGACFVACPMTRHANLEGADASEVTAGLRHLVRGEPASEDTLKWVGACAKSGLCVATCPQLESGLNAMLLVRIAKQHALNDTKQLPSKNDPASFPRVKAFARMQLTEEELKKWL